MTFGIEAIWAQEVLDSRGNPTVKATVQLRDGATGTTMVPSGASTGEHEAVELRDRDPHRYGGKGVLHAISNIENVIAPAICGKAFASQRDLDEVLCALDGTPNKRNLGANALLAVSLAAAHAGAAQAQLSLYEFLHTGKEFILPVPFMNVINGGAHAQTRVDFQEFMIAPVGASSFAEAVRAGSECFHALRTVLHTEGLNTGQGDEGGFAPELERNEAALELLIHAIEKAGYAPGDDIAIALDPAVSELYHDGLYHLQGEGTQLDAAALVARWEQWCAHYPIISIEDGMDQNDWAGWQRLTAALGAQVQLVGDDLFVTNMARLQEGVAKQVANALLVKVNQIGTLTETLDTVGYAQSHHYAVMVSHRSGETEDTTIADLAVACGAGQIKAGAPSRSERVAKYNRLLQIERELGSAGRYAGRSALAQAVPSP